MSNPAIEFIDEEMRLEQEIAGFCLKKNPTVQNYRDSIRTRAAFFLLRTVFNEQNLKRKEGENEESDNELPINERVQLRTYAREHIDDASYVHSVIDFIETQPHAIGEKKCDHLPQEVLPTPAELQHETNQHYPDVVQALFEGVSEPPIVQDSEGNPVDLLSYHTLMKERHFQELTQLILVTEIRAVQLRQMRNANSTKYTKETITKFILDRLSDESIIAEYMSDYKNGNQDVHMEFMPQVEEVMHHLLREGGSIIRSLLEYEASEEEVEDEHLSNAAHPPKREKE